MSREKEELQGVTLLGNQKTKYPQDYAPEMLETFINKHQDHDYFVKFNCPEFTSLCPMTGQPDFATIYISYVPDVKMVESKSLKLYLFSFRNHGDFHDGKKYRFCLYLLFLPLFCPIFSLHGLHSTFSYSSGQYRLQQKKQPRSHSIFLYH